MSDSLGDRMKNQYENRTRYYLPRRTYTIIRIDGKAFHTYTRKFSKPYSTEFNGWMDSTAQYALSRCDGGQFAYTQSDEISILLTDFTKQDTQAWFDGNLQKLCSISASYATAQFVHISGDLVQFDARAFTISDPNEVANYFLWRTRDCIRNSILSLAHHHLGYKAIHGKNTSEVQDMLHDVGVNWNDEPARFKTGSLQTRSQTVAIPEVALFDFYLDLIPKVPE